MEVQRQDQLFKEGMLNGLFCLNTVWVFSIEIVIQGFCPNYVIWYEENPFCHACSSSRSAWLCRIDTGGDLIHKYLIQPVYVRESSERYDNS